MKRGTFVGIAVLAMVCCGVPVLAAPQDPTADALLAEIFVPAPDQGTVPDPVTPLDQAPSPENRAIPCAADCWNGSVVTCSGSVSCQEVNSNCAAGQRGYCSGNITGIRYCPPCPAPCTARATCLPSGSVSCTSYKNNCFKIDKCYASCDGKLYWCPQHGTCPI